jgi:hypothetical protein
VGSKLDPGRAAGRDRDCQLASAPAASARLLRRLGNGNSATGSRIRAFIRYGSAAGAGGSLASALDLIASALGRRRLWPHAVRTRFASS